MASITYNRGKQRVLGGTTDLLNDTIKVALLTDAYTPSADHNFMSDVASAEPSVSGYGTGFSGSGRKTTASKTVTENDTDDRSEFDFADPVWSALGAGANIRYAVVYHSVTADADSPVLFTIDHGANVPTNGSDITLQVAATGGWHLT